MKQLIKFFKYLYVSIISLILIIIVAWALCEAYINITSPISIVLIIVGTIALIMLLGICVALIIDKIYNDAQYLEDEYDRFYPD